MITAIKKTLGMAFRLRWILGLFLLSILLPIAFSSKEPPPATLSSNATESLLLPPEHLSRLGKVSERDLGWERVIIKPGDTLANIFANFQLNSRQVHLALHAGKESQRLHKLQPGREMFLHLGESGQLLGLRYAVTPTQMLHVQQSANKWHSTVESVPAETRMAFGAATIKDSLFGAGKRAGLDDNIIMELSSLFSWDIDFLLDIRPEDRFKVLYQEEYAEGQKIGNGPILAAEFTNQNHTYQVFRYTDPDGRTDYYTPEGHSIKKAFLRTPVKFTRISSKFDLHRKHPVLHKIRAHKGVDYAAPYGTPVKSVGDGRVKFAGVQGGYGNIIQIQHGKKYVTAYAHLARFAKGMRPGVPVAQGQVIGYVGATGLATAPHLHYEFQVNGVHQNPLTVDLPNAMPIPSFHWSNFHQHVLEAQALLERHERVMLASTTPLDN